MTIVRKTEMAGIHPGIIGLAALCLLLAFSSPTQAQDAMGDLFGVIAKEIPAAELQLLHNLNDREDAAGRPDPPRLGGFADLPEGEFPGSAEIEAWEAAFQDGEISGLVLHSGAYPVAEGPVAEGSTLIDDEPAWFRSRDRIIVTFSSQDSDLAERISRSARAGGYDAFTLAPGAMAPGSISPGIMAPGTIAPGDKSASGVPAGAFYATATHRLAIDSRTARRLRTDVAELELLGERARRNSDSVFRDPANRDDRSRSRYEPEIFRKITLGDEFTQPTIEEIIVPGGIALGESATLDFAPVELVFSGGDDGLPQADSHAGSAVVTGGAFRLLGINPASGESVVRQLPDDDPKLLKSLFDLARRSIRTRSDAVVDLDAEQRVRISSALRDTDAGYQMLFADTRPFEFLDYLPVTKSVIIDTGVSWRGVAGSPLQFETAFEVRFLSADRMRIAQTRLALEYEYDSRKGLVNYQGNWGRDAARLRDSTDLGGLGDELSQMARHAGWVALFRRIEADQVPFLRGRYEFMKIDKTGRETPRRFR